jgi:broad specificity phosphatase PhoE
MRRLPSLAEIDCGELEGLPLADIRERYPDLWLRNEAQEDETFCWPGGETYARFRIRVMTAVRRIAALHEGERVLVVTHAGVVSQILGSIAGQNPARWENFRPGYGSVTEVLWCGNSGHVARFDDCGHLPPDVR